MDVMIIYFKALLVLRIVLSENVENSENITATCGNKITDIYGTPIDVTRDCKGNCCIAKCCKAEEIMYYSKNTGFLCLELHEVQNLTKTPIKVDYKDIPIYKDNIEEKLERTDKNLIDDYRFISNEKLSIDDCLYEPDYQPEPYYILENGTLILESPNYYNRWIRKWKFEDFCMEYLVKKTKSKGVQGPFVTYRLYLDPTEDNYNPDNESTLEIYYAAAMLLSCFFLLFVFFVYASIRELRNLVGMILMAYVATLFLMFLLKAVHILAVDTTDVCKPFTVVLYYLILSSFCWMNIMSLDIWWIFRGMFYSRATNRREDLVKFVLYGLYAWGVPLLVTIIAAVIDYTDLKHLPHIFQPHFDECLVKNDESWFYVYMPCLALIILNWIFFLMTAFKIWRIRKNMEHSSNESSKCKKQRNRFWLYLKLALVMGVSWILEVIELPYWLEVIGGFYNCLTGVAIFFIFVFKRKIILMLFKRFSIEGKFVNALQRNYSKYSQTSASSCDRKHSAMELHAVQ